MNNTNADKEEVDIDKLAFKKYPVDMVIDHKYSDGRKFDINESARNYWKNTYLEGFKAAIQLIKEGKIKI